MAVEVENSGQVDELLRIIRRRAVWVLYPASLALTLGICFAIIVPKKFVCETTILVRNTLENATAAQANTADEARMADHRIKSLPRIQAVLVTLGWSDYLNKTPSERNEFEKKIAKSVRVATPSTPADGQQIVKISYSNTDPTRAKAFLDELTARWKYEVLEQGINAQRTAWEKLKSNKNALLEQRSEKIQKITELRKSYGIPVDTSGNTSRFGSPTDPTFIGLEGLQGDLQELQLEILAIETNLSADRDRLAAEPLMISETEIEGAVENQGKIDRLNEKIFELQQEIQERGYKPDHPKYTRINSDIRAIQEQIRFLESTEVAGIQTDSRVPIPKRPELEESIAESERQLAGLLQREASLEARITDQRDRANELQDVYAQIETLESDVRQFDVELETNSAQLAKQAANYQWMQGPGGNPFEVLEETQMPQEPSEPSPVLIVLFSLFIGLAIGLGLAALTEFGKSVFRTVNDVSRVMVVPVLGTINLIETQREVRRKRITGLFVGSVTLGLISILSYVTWAWKVNPQLLSNTVYEKIETFRANFE